MTISEPQYLKERPYIVMGTGHRPKYYVSYAEYENSLSILKDSIAKVIEEKEITIDLIISGFALGFDTALAMYAIEKKIPLHAYIPFVGQEYKWSTSSQHNYQWMIQHAERINISIDRHPEEYRGIAAALHKRNYEMLNIGLYFVTFHRPDITTGGTVDTINKAKTNGIYTVPVWPEYKKQAKVKKIKITQLKD
jgi:uncharacterized phage-like protein YoqJ